MRIQLIIILALFSFSISASEDQEMKELFKKYDLVMDHKKIELIDEVFTKNFIKGSGGKEELIDKIKELTVPKEKALKKDNLSWKKGQKGEVYLATLEEHSTQKNKKDTHKAEFIILKEDGKFKINGTLSDGD